jgi:integrase/recombinase XerD
MPASGVESWTLVGSDRRPVAVVDEYLAWLTHIERSPNTVEAYARDLKVFWSFLASRELAWDRVRVAELGEFAAWARRPAENVVVLSELAARRSAGTVNRILTAVVGFYEFQGPAGELAGQGAGGADAHGPWRLQAVLAWDRSRGAAGAGGQVCPCGSGCRARSAWGRWRR